MPVKLWSAGEKIESSDTPIFFRSADQAAAVASIISSGHMPAAYSVTPNGEKFVDFFLPYVLWQRRASFREFMSADYSGSLVPVRDIVALCFRICASFAEFATDQAIAACSELSYLLANLPTSARALVPPKLEVSNAILLELAISCLKPMEYGSPFVHMGTSEQNKSWWKTAPAHLSNLIRLSKRRNIEFAGIQDALKPVDQWIQQIQGRLARMQALPPQGAARAAAIIEASAYCCAVAERHLMRAHHGLAVLHLHRAFDLMLFAVCDQAGVIDHTSHGGRYAASYVPSNGGNKVTLMNSLDASKGLVAPSPARENAVRELNDWRNLLLQTHYMTAMDDAKARELFAHVRPHLEALGGNQWASACDSYVKGVQLTLADLLDVDGTLSTGVQEVIY